MFSRVPIPTTTSKVAVYRDRDKANKAASKLIEGGIDPKAITITGTGLRAVERLVGKFTIATALRNGITNGLFFGLVLASFSLLVNPEAPAGAFIGMLIVGLAAGVLLGLVSFAMMRRKRDFLSTSQVVADEYELGVTVENLSKAREVLGYQQAATRPEVDLSEPPRYGERIEDSDAT